MQDKPAVTSRSRLGAVRASRPGGIHVMLIGLAQPLEAGASFPLTLRFEHAGERSVTAEVRAG